MGLSIAKVFGAHDFRVALVSRNQDKLDDLAAQLEQLGIEAAGFAADLMDRPTITEAFASIKERYGIVDVLEYSPAPHVPVPGVESVDALHLTVETVQPQIEFYLYGAIAATQQVLPDMVAAGRGTILFTTGGSAVNARPWISNVGIGGAALRSWAESLRLALVDTGVYVAHVPIGVWIGKDGPDADAIAPAYWDLHTKRDDASRCYVWWDRSTDAERPSAPLTRAGQADPPGSG
ncbi:MAG: hypothetical protein QOC92_3281 [Acidimicrobiaceae bacterium]|jgi:NAD(P)-dependent dehydrogenase (short-subunit alcohol dehydrogenase family)